MKEKFSKYLVNVNYKHKVPTIILVFLPTLFLEYVANARESGKGDQVSEKSLIIFR